MRWSTWKQLDGVDAIDVAAVGTNGVWAIDSNGYPQLWDGSVWMTFADGLRKAREDQRG